VGSEERGEAMTTATTEPRAERPATAELSEVRDVSHEFLQPSGKPLRVLEDVTLSVHPNEVVALLGPSGCGKSTILRILAGLIRPTRGEVLYHGQPLHGLNPGVAIVFQSFALYPWMTVRENVEAVLRAAGRPPKEVREGAEAAIKMVGLVGFEEVYPRQLSGGMKQRIGMARGLSVDPEILLMDEPFSHVDALTSESLRAEVLDIWGARKQRLSSILLVSHDIKEVAYMADRIVILGANPGRVRTVVENRLPRPRDYRSQQLLSLVDYLHEIIMHSELPDPPAPAAAAGPARPPSLFEPLPDVRPSEVVGLLEYLDARGGKEDVFRIASDTNQEFGHVILAVRAAEMLDLVDTPKRLVVLEPEGKAFVKASPQERQAEWGRHLLKLRLFRDVVEALKKQPKHEIDRDFVLELMVMNMPQENYERMFVTFIHWARFGDLLDYDEHKEVISLPEEPAI
jgi:NitT/TauT family transport system ATP-binding protein